MLHYDYLAEGVHVDKTIMNRDLLSSRGIDEKEKAANAFAAELLMPEPLLKPYIGRGLDFNNEEVIEALARRFRVSTTALSYRLFIPAKEAEGKQRTLPLS
jgi:Zn-dependent peptidase ImmA (M78 family)